MFNLECENTKEYYSYMDFVVLKFNMWEKSKRWMFKSDHSLWPPQASLSPVLEPGFGSPSPGELRLQLK